MNGGKTNPNLYLSELSLRDISHMFTDKTAMGLKEIVICGSYGEPVMAKEFLEIVEFFIRKSPDARIIVDTNGSVRHPEWWKKLGQLLAPRDHFISFGLDGLADTHAIYRRGTSFEKILENAKAFIGAGGKARWIFLVFKHNEHQVESARKLSIEMEFDSFVAKKTGRFFLSKTYEKRKQFPVQNENGEIEYYLEPPTRAEFLNSAVEAVSTIASEYGSFDDYLDKTPINCESIHKKRIYVSASGLVLPCGHLNHQLFDADGLYGDAQKQTRDLLDKKDLDGKQHSIEEIIASPSFQKIAKSWEERSVKEGRLKVCSLFCGKSFNKVGAQFIGVYGAY